MLLNFKFFFFFFHLIIVEFYSQDFVYVSRFMIEVVRREDI